MAGVIDTNILLYAANQDSQAHSRALQFLTEAGRSVDQWYLTEGNLYEFLRVATHARVFPQPLSWRQSLSFLEAFFESSQFKILGTGNRHWRVLRQLLEETGAVSGNLFFDTRTVALMIEHGVRRIYTADRDFLGFAGIEVVNPLSPTKGS